jgi:hypothetical protein
MGIVINNPSSATRDNRNYIINSDFKVAQAATSATITAGNAIPTASLGYPVLDCWFAYSVGANSTLSQEGNLSAKRLQIQTNANTAAMGIGQRIESADAVNLATKTVTLSFECSHSNLTSLTITASRPTTSADTFGTIASPTKTQIATTTISITNASTRFSWSFTCPQEVERGLEVLFTFGSNASSGTFQLANVKLEESSSATSFIPTIYVEELRKCQRYFIRMSDHLYSYYTAAGQNLTTESLHLNMFGTTRIRNLISSNPTFGTSSITVSAGISADSTRATYTSPAAGFYGGSPIYTVSAYIP